MAIARSGKIIASVGAWLLVRIGADDCSGTFDVPEGRPDNDIKQHNGATLRDVCISREGPYHVFVIGDWGGTGNPPRPAQNRGNLQDPVDYDAQQRVAMQMHLLGLEVNPDYVLNVGDSFYWGGIDKTCMQTIEWSDQWANVFNNVYAGAGLAGRPWLGVLGNHDYGGYRYDTGWSQIITMSWVDLRWRIPAQYWNVRVKYSNFDVDYFFLDSNSHSCADPSVNPKHNICSTEHNGDGMNCSAVGGPDSVHSCPTYFTKLWDEQVDWLKGKLTKSKATPYEVALEDILDMLDTSDGGAWWITGHLHYQLFWGHNDDANPMKPTSVLISGGGGGITSEDIPREDGDDDTYGFVDLELAKDTIGVRMISHGGKVRKNVRIKHCYGGDGADRFVQSCDDDGPTAAPTKPSEEPAPVDAAAEESVVEGDAPNAGEDDVSPTLTDRLKQMLGWWRAGRVLQAVPPPRVQGCAVAFAAALSSAALIAAWRLLGDRGARRATSHYATLGTRHALVDEVPGLQLLDGSGARAAQPTVPQVGVAYRSRAFSPRQSDGGSMRPEAMSGEERRWLKYQLAQAQVTDMWRRSSALPGPGAALHRGRRRRQERAFRRLALAHHPDKHGGAPEDRRSAGGHAEVPRGPGEAHEAIGEHLRRRGA
ncbi:unnamed protein product [Prorocentrum cordatum]|uniref:Calcineurin-like phosphoesterase domain-containing protein n=1 Tax=Prorocentrum cordatum TaxID=2364126 RepID=A0ABN9UW79_9DINO|nr:unnamed protein product [Polarella glacialis]